MNLLRDGLLSHSTCLVSTSTHFSIHPRTAAGATMGTVSRSSPSNGSDQGPAACGGGTERRDRRGAAAARCAPGAEDADDGLQRISDDRDIVVLTAGAGRALRGDQPQLLAWSAQEVSVAAQELRSTVGRDLVPSPDVVIAMLHKVNRGACLARQPVDGGKLVRPLRQATFLESSCGADRGWPLTRHRPFGRSSSWWS
jgi:hypothetical protein